MGSKKDVVLCHLPFPTVGDILTLDDLHTDRENPGISFHGAEDI